MGFSSAKNNFTQSKQKCFQFITLFVHFDNYSHRHGRKGEKEREGGRDLDRDREKGEKRREIDIFDEW